ncbi:hypothetical protein VTH06DRAFT_426 [Thermothelomyces fergusii]
MDAPMQPPLQPAFSFQTRPVAMANVRDITELPHDVFLLVIRHLSPRTCIRCRAVSRRWHAAFTEPETALSLLRWNFPRCRELRLATVAAAAAAAATPLSTLSESVPRNIRAELVDVAEQPRDWSSTFAEVARRYFHLNQGRPRAVEKLELAQSGRGDGPAFSFRCVAPWNRFLRLDDKVCTFHYPDPVWWYSQEDGLLAYPAAVDAATPEGRDGYVYRLLDLATGDRFPVPFDTRSKHIRRVRLAHGVLIFEWAEAHPYHQLNDREVVHRHFVTAFDVIREPSATAPGAPSWTVAFRSEWKLHFLGLPLNQSDRFFSTHTNTHYAVYFWQPNRSLYQDDPIEQLAVWDISSPSPYRPSEDPRGDRRPAATRTPSLPTGLWNGRPRAGTSSADGIAGPSAHEQPSGRGSLAEATAGPQVIRRMAWRELDFYGLRQRATPRLRGLALDSESVYVIEEEHRWAAGQHSSLTPPRVHLVRSTGIPVIPAPTPTPSARRPPQHPIAARSASDLQAVAGRDDPRPSPTLDDIVSGPVHGPIWVDSCGADGDVNMNFCRRVADANGTSWPGTAAGGGDGEGLDAPPRPRAPEKPAGWPWSQAETGSSRPAFASEANRWPGLAPCWRHEDFPYLTVAEMVDFAAGVRVAARRCFMLETLSAHVKPTVTFEAAVGPAGSTEVPFPDEMWSELVARGHIAGDERWIVGEDDQGRVTIVRF